MTIIVTGAAGFIGFNVATALLARGQAVLGIDNLNAYYDVALKEARLAQLRRHPGFRFIKADVADRTAMDGFAAAAPDATGIIHLAAQAGVRYSLENPFAYIDANVTGQMVMLETARRLKHLRHMVYASTSSVYGGNTKLPFSVDDRVDQPISIYAATKKAAELSTHCYSHLYGLPATGLRFFTVYGPWGRPDMAAYLFAEAILAGQPIRVFNGGHMKRDFTYIDDIVAGVLAALDRPPEADAAGLRHRLYNLGNCRTEDLMDFISILEGALGQKAVMRFEPMQPGDVPATYADIETSRRDLGFEPKIPIATGLPRFVEWHRRYRAGEFRPDA
jgi:UDP-glucuronate 4-epimerase